MIELPGASIDLTTLRSTPAAMRLSRVEEELALEPKSFRLLQFLIENRERLIA